MRRVLYVALAAAAAGWVACGGGTSPIGPVNKVPTVPGGPSVDAGGTGPDAGLTTDAGGGNTDAGQPGVDAGHPTADAGTVADAGTAQDAGTHFTPPDGGGNGAFPSIPNWTFYGPDAGGPSIVRGVTVDEGGNVWVAGGEDGVFLLAPGATQFRQFTLADGLHPYGYMPDGGPATTTPYLNVLSVAGGPSGTVFVGYSGKPSPWQDGSYPCEDNWDGPNPDPDIYKSGDADRVTLSGAGIAVVHYDIFSGPNEVKAEMRGREKLCHIWSIRYDPGNHAVWFGGNHGFAWGDADYAGDPSCNGAWACSGLIEHSHPGFNGYYNNTNNDCCAYVTEDYHGVAVNLATHDVWFGGANRSTNFEFGTENGFWGAQNVTETAAVPGQPSDHIDIWPDQVPEWDIPHPSQEQPMDNVSAMAAMPDGSVWAASYAWGLAHIRSDADAGYVVDAYLSSELMSPNVSALAYDGTSLWAGQHYLGGMDRITNGQVVHYDTRYFGAALGQNPIGDIQVDATGPGRRLLVGFQAGPQVPAGIGIYTGP